MQDRVPTKPNRYAVYDDAHNFIRYEYHERADEPTQVGDALNKANLLPDAVAAALGLTGNPQVGDALTKLFDIANPKAKIATGSYTGTGTYGSSNPNSLMFPFVPKAIFISCRTAEVSPDCDYKLSEEQCAFALNGQVHVGIETSYSSSASRYLAYFTWSDKTVSWYSTISTQLNDANKVYYYVALG